MGSTWNRDVLVVPGASDDGSGTFHLTVVLSEDDANPEGDTKSTANAIYTGTEDRKGANGARIMYRSLVDGMTLTGIEPSDQNGLTVIRREQGRELLLKDQGGSGVKYDYRLVGRFRGHTIDSPDPEIHNEDD